jgi:hypothetical protein
MKGGQLSLHMENLIWDVRSSDQECQRFSSRVTDGKPMHKQERANESPRRRRNRLHNRESQLIGIDMTIIQPLVRKFGVDADPVGHLSAFMLEN